LGKYIPNSGDLTYKNNRIKFKIRKKYKTIKKNIELYLNASLTNRAISFGYKTKEYK
jgi:hypothetical protein